MEDTHHGFYLLVAKVCHQSRPVVDEGRSVSQQSVDCNLGGDPDIGEREASTRGLPLTDVHQPLAGGARLEEVAELKTKKWNSDQAWNV